jgi:hypothetical protein
VLIVFRPRSVALFCSEILLLLDVARGSTLYTENGGPLIVSRRPKRIRYTYEQYLRDGQQQGART